MTVRSVQRSLCAQCGRTCYERSDTICIEAARTSDGKEPVEDYLAGLEKSKGHRGTNVTKLATIAIAFEEFVYGPEPQQPRELNYLEDEIWEIKAGVSRLPFFYLKDRLHGTALRITSGFEKRQQKAPRGEIRRAIWVREQDSSWQREIGG